MVTGLAWTSMGGSILFIETTLTRPLDIQAESKEQGSITITGSLGNVMKESVQIAYTYAKSFLVRQEPNNLFLQRGHLHVHVPEVRVEVVFRRVIIQKKQNNYLSTIIFKIERVQHQKMVLRLVARL